MKNLLRPLQVVGIVDSEGMFFIAVYKRKDRNNIRYVYSVEFKLTQMGYSKDLLYKLQEFFGCGRVVIDNKITGGYKYVITDIKNLVEKILPFFDKNVLLTSKYIDYKIFREAILMIKDKGVITEELYNEINKLKAKKGDKKEIFEFSEFHSTLDKITKDWLVGFIEGDGSFQFNIRNPMYASLEIAQSKVRRPLLEAIKEYFKGGLVKPKLNKNYDIKELEKSRGTHRFVLRDIKILEDKVIPMFKELELYSNKQEDLKDWIKLVSKFKSGDHKSEEGLREMLNIKNGMNRGRHKKNNS